MFEHRRTRLLTRIEFLRRQLRFAVLAGSIVAGSLAAGALGYHATEGLPWLDALLNAAMILTGMGPVDSLRTSAGKVFAIAYAMTSSVVLLTTVGILFAPLAHRVLHRFHLEQEHDDE